MVAYVDRRNPETEYYFKDEAPFGSLDQVSVFYKTGQYRDYYFARTEEEAMKKNRENWAGGHNFRGEYVTNDTTCWPLLILLERWKRQKTDEPLGETNK